MTGQMVHHRVCQTCGRSIPSTLAEADGWLVAPWIAHPEFLIVRCYRHITDHALRVSVRRTNAWRERMRAGRRRAAEEPDGIHPYNEPFPLKDEP